MMQLQQTSIPFLRSSMGTLGGKRGPSLPPPERGCSVAVCRRLVFPFPPEARDVTGAQATCTQRIVYYWSLAREQADRQSKKIR